MMHHKQSGFTLIETLIYIALFSFMLTGTVLSVYQIVKAAGDSSLKTTINDEGNFLLRKFNWALTGATAINSPSPDSSGTTLSVTKLNFASNPLVFTSMGNDIILARGSNAGLKLNSQNVIIANVVFQNIAAVSGKPSAARISFTVNGQPFELLKYLRQ